MAQGVFDQILNAVIPPAVIGFIIYIIYKIPLVKKGVDALIGKFKDWKDGRSKTSNTSYKNTIQYE